MNKMAKAIALMLVLSILGTTVSFPAEASNKGKITTKAWLGRPAGNGDGSEEWLNGSYGQTNGPYRYLTAGSGRVEDLNRAANTANNIRWFLVSTCELYLVVLVFF